MGKEGFNYNTKFAAATSSANAISSSIPYCKAWFPLLHLFHTWFLAFLTHFLKYFVFMRRVMGHMKQEQQDESSAERELSCKLLTVLWWVMSCFSLNEKQSIYIQSSKTPVKFSGVVQGILLLHFLFFFFF